ncbi:MAG: serine/threonine-protein kinase [Planctomycetaceae bacterium]
MEPPTPSLIAALRDLGLARPRDLRRAARHCRQLSLDLPAFDSVWIDSLVRLRRLTLFQAKELQERRGDRLRIGGYVVRDRLGEGRDCSTYVAHRTRDEAVFTLKEIFVAAERRPSVVDRLQALVAAGSEFRSPHLIMPHEIVVEPERVVIVSRHVQGPDARSALIRQGRFADADVAEIARQILEGLQDVHRLGLAHGDIHAGNLRLNGRHGVVLVDSGVRQAIQPVVSIHDARPPSWYEGTAPERLGTSVVASPSSDVYSLGCLLWHLLAGRPPFPAGDALTMLAAHRTRPLPPVRDFAPDTAPALAQLIEDATRLDPEARPTDLAELQRRLRSMRSVGGSGMRRRSRSVMGKEFPWPTAAAALLTLGAACVGLADRNAVTTLLSIGAGTGDILQRGADDEANGETVRQFIPLPAPDDQGIISLDDAGPYSVSDVDVRGSLIIRGRSDRPATIVITDRPLHVRADELTLEYIHVEKQSPPGYATGTAALLLVEAQNLTIQSCRFDCPIASIDRRTSSPAGIAWRMIDRKDPTAGRLTLKDSVVRGVRETLILADPARRVHLSNILAVGVHSLAAMQDTGEMPTELTIERTTLRDAAAVVRLGSQATDGEVQIIARDSILDLATNGALFTAPTSIDHLKWRWQGSGVVTTGDVRAFATTTAIVTADASVADAPQSADVAGISRATVEFAGSAEGSDAASVATVRGVPRQAGQRLGVDLSCLPKATHVSGGPR